MRRHNSARSRKGYHHGTVQIALSARAFYPSGTLRNRPGVLRIEELIIVLCSERLYALHSVTNCLLSLSLKCCLRPLFISVQRSLWMRPAVSEKMANQASCSLGTGSDLFSQVTKTWTTCKHTDMHVHHRLSSLSWTRGRLLARRW